MADNKKYYYLKLKENFFDSEEMIILQSMQDGYIYSDILMKLYLRSLKNEGKLMFKDVIPYTPDVLATVVRHQVGTVEKALDLFQKLGLVEMLDNGAIYMMDIQNFIGESSTEADRKRKYRAKIEQEKSNKIALIDDVGQMSGQMSSKCPDKNPPELEIELEIEKELDIELEKDIEKKKREKKKTTDSSESSSSSSSSKKTKKVVKHKYGEYDNVLLSDEELDKLKKDFPTDYQDRIDRLSEYVASTGKTYKNYLATIRAWARKEKQVQTYKQPQQQEEKPKNWWEETI